MNILMQIKRVVHDDFGVCLLNTKSFYHMALGENVVLRLMECLTPKFMNKIYGLFHIYSSAYPPWS